MTTKSSLTDVEAIYAERASRLAQPASAILASNRRHALLVSLGEEQYAIEADHLVSVIPKAPCASVPGAAPEIAGLLAFRGRILAVVDLALLLGLKHGQTPQRPVLIVRAGAMRVGLAVDAINEMRELPPAVAESFDPSLESAAKFVHRPHDGLPWMIRMNALLSHPVMKSLS